MKLTLAEPRLLKEPVSILSDLVNDVSFKVDNEKLEIVATDPANVVMVVFKLLSSAFIEYEVGSSEVISISLDNLNQILRRLKGNDTLSLELDKEKNKLKINMSGDSSRTFNLNLIELEDKDQNIPELSFKSKVVTNSKMIEDAIEDVGIVAESVSLGLDKEKMMIRGEGNLSNAHVELNKNEDTEIETENEIISKYSIEYLKKLIRGGKLSDKVVLEWADDYPLRLEYNVIDKLALSFILAPRVSDE
ncbi:MAG: proliferating cell nuclear antigen (pcna) [Nanoarchaeota archaeon]|jgi:proliferating cell nuclear antigen|nr:proliferating cell nuclear antigen (pcna) [Nanoarchaeota archaeon]|tara:strand:- start:2417 stop:3160 length:744 start_codon:yes stop_codon:yes gene_type:complete